MCYALCTEWTSKCFPLVPCCPGAYLGKKSNTAIAPVSPSCGPPDFNMFETTKMRTDKLETKLVSFENALQVTTGRKNVFWGLFCRQFYEEKMHVMLNRRTDLSKKDEPNMKCSSCIYVNKIHFRFVKH